MLRSAIFTLLLLSSCVVHGNDGAAVLSLWAAQVGSWSGHIDIYGPDLTVPKTVELRTRWDAVPDNSIVTKIETFSSAAGDTSAVTLMYVDEASGLVVTPYYFSGGQRDYRFAVTAVSFTDETHWSTTIATPAEQEEYEGRPARLRYVRTRIGSTIENTKEVRFLDVDGETWELRSFIRQTLTP